MALLNGQIISVDSMKYISGLSEPPSRRRKRKQIPYHLIDVVQPHESFSVDRFLVLANRAIAQIVSSGRPVIAVGALPCISRPFCMAWLTAPAQIRLSANDFGTNRLQRSFRPHQRLAKSIRRPPSASTPTTKTHHSGHRST